MDIIPFISEIVNLFYDFDDVEGFYSNNTLMLVQGIIKGYGSVNSIAEDNLVSHTKLTRFLRGHKGFWDTFKMKFQEQMLEDNEDIFIVDDTQIDMTSKKIPFVKKIYDLPSDTIKGKKLSR